MKEGTWILIAEDDDNDVLFIQRALDKAGIHPEYHIVQDGVELLDCLRKKLADTVHPHDFPSVILLDERMPRMSGIDALRAIKSHPDFRLIPVVMHSGQMNEAEIRKAYALGANGYVEKPAGPERFRKIFETLGIYWADVNVPPTMAR